MKGFNVLIILLWLICSCEYVWYDYTQIEVDKMYDYYFENDIPEFETIIEIQNFILKSIKYRHDITGGNQKDYWQLPEQTWSFKYGDCEDFTLLFLYICKEQFGISGNLIYVIDKYSNEGHVLSKIDIVYYESTGGSVWPEKFYYNFNSCYKIIWECTYEEALWMTYYYHDNVGKYY